MMAIVSVILMLFVQGLIEPYFRWFTPDLFFIALVLHILVYRSLDFISLFFIALFYDIFTSGVFGGTVLTIAIIFYFIEISRFHYLRHFFVSSTGLIFFFYTFYLILQHMISYGIEGLINNASFYLFYHALTTTLVWMLLWRIQSKKR